MAQTDSDSLYNCNAYNQTFRDVQESLHIYNYIDAADLPIRLQEGETTPEAFAVYQCPAYGAHELETPLNDAAINESNGGINLAVHDVNDSLPNEIYPLPADDKEVNEDYDCLNADPDENDSLPDERYQTVELSNMQLQ